MSARRLPAGRVPVASVTLFTYNMGGHATPAELTRLVRLAARPESDEIPHTWAGSLQEVADQQLALDRTTSMDGGSVGLVQGPQGKGRQKCAIVAPRDHLGPAGLIKLTDRAFVGPLGAGGAWTDHKYLTWAELNVGPVTLRTSSVHLMSSVQRPPFPGRTKRRRLWHQQADGVLRFLEQHRGKGPTFTLGDFNATEDSDLMDVFRRRNVDMLGAGSHGGRGRDQRDIDKLLTLERLLDRDRVHVTSQAMLSGYRSDHRPGVWRLLITRPARS